MELLVVGDVAGGASAAARARRLSEDAEVVVFERGPDVSFANCGLPYYVGGEIATRGKLLVVTPDRLRERFRLDVRVRSSVEAIDRARKVVRVRDLATGREYEGGTTSSSSPPARRRSARRCRASTSPACSPCGRCTTWTGSRGGWTRAWRGPSSSAAGSSAWNWPRTWPAAGSPPPWSRRTTSRSPRSTRR